MTTPHKSFEERVDEVLNAHLNEIKAGHDSKLKAALLAAHKEEVERIIDTDKTIWLTHGNEAIDDAYIKGRKDLRAEQRTRANLTGKEEV